MEKEKKAEPLKVPSILNLLDDNAAAAASEVFEDEDCLLIDNEVDYPVDPMKGNHNSLNIAHDCEQDAEKLHVNNLFDGEDEREDEGGNSKMIEDLKTKGETITLESDVEGVSSGKEITSEVDEPKPVVMKKMNVCNNGHEGEQEPNNLPFKKNAIDKKGNVCNDEYVNEKQQDAHIINLNSNINTRNRKGTVNKKEAGVEEERGRGNTPKMEEVFKTSTVCNDVPQKQQDAHIINLTSSINTRNKKESVNDKQAREEEEKGGGNTPKMEEVFKTSTEDDNKDAVNTPEMDGATEDSEEERQDGGNIPADYNGECDGEQDADNSPSSLNGTNIWQFFSWEFCLILLIGILIPAAAFAKPASYPHKYAADPGSTQTTLWAPYQPKQEYNQHNNMDEFRLSSTEKSLKIKKRDSDCHSYASDFTRYSCFEDSSACRRKQENIQCPLGLKSVCLFFITKKAFFAGCMNPQWLSKLKGTECPRVTYIMETKKFEVYCYENECLECSGSDLEDMRLFKCLQTKTSDSTTPRSTTPRSTGNRKEQLHWIKIGAAVYIIFKLQEQIFL